jgi:hypothetical protein
MKLYRVKYQERWYDAEEFQHPGMIEPGYLIGCHVFNKSDFEAYYLVSDNKKVEGNQNEKNNQMAKGK